MDLPEKLMLPVKRLIVLCLLLYGGNQAMSQRRDVSRRFLCQ